MLYGPQTTWPPRRQQLLHARVVLNHASGTTNIISRTLASRSSQKEAAAIDEVLHDRLFGPVAMRSAQPKFDTAGTFSIQLRECVTLPASARCIETTVLRRRNAVPAGWATCRHVQRDDEGGFNYGHGCGRPATAWCHGFEASTDRSDLMVHRANSPSDIVNDHRDIFESCPVGYAHRPFDGYMGDNSVGPLTVSALDDTGSPPASLPAVQPAPCSSSSSTHPAAAARLPQGAEDLQSPLLLSLGLR